MAQLQPTLVSNSCLHGSARSSSRPMLPLKIRANACFASTDNSSSRSGGSSFRARSIANTAHHRDQVVRPLVNYSPDMWGDRFLTLPFTDSEFESCSRQVEILKEMVKDMLMTSVVDPIENIHMINSLSRLGISYHFESEIEEQLSHLFITLPQFIDNNKDYDLHTVAIIFQVFRAHGYKMPCDVFNKFKNGDGMFKEEVASNINGMISLYEASHWRMHGELILDEALALTTLHLESLQVSQSCPDHLREYIANALHRPYHKGMPRLEARQYISFYEKDDESRNDILLKFAKYDYNRVQMHHQQELSLLSSWWKKSKIESSFPHIRHRIVESFFLAVGMHFEPRFALARGIIAKWYMAFALLDDTYDAYGLYEELQYLTKAMERYDINAKDELPGDYLKCLYETILNISDEVEKDVISKEGRSFGVSYAKEQIKKQVLAYHVQAGWTDEVIWPAFDEYLENGIWSSAASSSLALLMMGMEEADEDAYQWLINCDSKIVRATSLLCRLYNDIQSNEDEEKRGQLSGITCYMKEYDVSKEKAIEGYRERIRDAWKDLNEGFMVRPTPVASQILLAAFNIARAVEVCFEEDDGFTKPDITYKHYITKVLIDPMPL